MVESNNLNNPTIVEGKQSGISNNSDLQTFTQKKNLFESEIVKHRVNENKIYKYIPIDNLLSSLHDGYIYLSSPKNWDDPYEMKYLDRLKLIDKVPDSMKHLKVFAMCFSSSPENEEALWKVYTSSGDNFVRLTIDYDEMVKQLEKNRRETFLTAMVYKKREEILEDKFIGKGISEIELSNNELFEKKLFINNFSLKQKAYEYENEIRLCAFGEEGDYMLIKDFKWKDVIETITFPPYTKGDNRGLYDIYHYYLTKKLKFEKKQILMSRLYDMDKEAMETAYELKYKRWRL